jgi:hypothetical protein
MKTQDKLSAHSIVQRNPKLIANQMDGEIVMLSIDKGEYYGLDEIGSRIWELLETPMEIDHLIDSLISEFEVTREECYNDTLDFLKEMLEKDLLLVKNESAS